MKYIDLYNYLRDNEELNRVQAIRSILDIRHFAPEIKEALKTWASTGKCNITIADVSYNELVNEIGMKPIRAFKMLDWLRREPVLAHRYLAQRKMRADLSKHGSASIATNIDEPDKSDVEL